MHDREWLELGESGRLDPGCEMRERDAASEARRSCRYLLDGKRRAQCEGFGTDRVRDP